MRPLLILLIAYFSISPSMSQEATDNKRDLDWAKFGRYEQANKALQRGAVGALFIGNSITDDWVKLSPEFFDSNNIVGRGISGQSSAEILVRFQADVINLAPKVVVINLGINDIARVNGYISKENIVLNLKSMCQLALFNDIIPILTTTLPSNNVWGWPTADYTPAEDIAQLNDLIKELACSLNVEFVDYYTQLADKNGGVIDGLSYDGTHPTIEGYVEMEKIIIKLINKYL